MYLYVLTVRRWTSLSLSKIVKAFARCAKWMKGEEDQDATATIDKAATNDPETANSLTTGADEDDEVWVQAYDRESRSYYYWNRETGQTSWEKP